MRFLLRPLCWARRAHRWQPVFIGFQAGPAYSYCTTCGAGRRRGQRVWQQRRARTR